MKNVSKRVIFLFSTLLRLCVSVAFGMKKQPFVFIPSAVWTIGIFLAATTCLLKSISSLQGSANSLHFLRRCESTSRISCKTYTSVSWMLHLWTLNLFKLLCKNNRGNWPQLRVSPDLGTCWGEVATLACLDIDMLPSTGQEPSLQNERPFFVKAWL